ncbi:MAG: single-stranded DNA-binding protein [Anaerolineae bacterium]|nr:single-stranded DNA-binding protein [Anaerolineae bacterium]
MAYQQVIIVGNLGRDPEIRYTQSGQAVCGFSVAVNEVWTDRQSNERREKTTWFRVSVWGPQAETTSRYLAKGRQVMVIGTVEARAYLDQGGQPQATLELRARDVRFLGGQGGPGQPGGEYEDYSGGSGSGEMGDIPF